PFSFSEILFELFYRSNVALNTSNNIPLSLFAGLQRYGSKRLIQTLCNIYPYCTYNTLQFSLKK
ncbi:hypothetical protein QWY89_20845, partial [Mucilaginibacter myungsuensis]|uniref:hypothetical protein n=1 Tax=Mucilaginibacter myungsuensis TaxID=649104 RepID=UPI0025B36E64